MDISIIVPVFNEAENISILGAELKEVMDNLGKSYEIIFINDGSTDNTHEELVKIKNDNANTKVISLNKNFGQTPAIMAGFDHSSGDIIITMDGDLQNDPHDIPALLKEIEAGNDIVSGWRKKRKDNFLLRVLPSRTANFIISIVLRVPLHDYGCTLKAYKKSALKGIRLYGEMHRFIPAIANWNGAKITEIEVNHRPRKHGKTKYGLNRIIKILLDLPLIVFLSEYSTKPIRFFGGLSMFSMGLGFITLFFVIYMKIASHTDMSGNPLLILAVLFFLVSIQLLSMGFLGEINIRTYYESQNKKTYHLKETLQ